MAAALLQTLVYEQHKLTASIASMQTIAASAVDGAYAAAKEVLDAMDAHISRVRHAAVQCAVQHSKTCDDAVYGADVAAQQLKAFANADSTDALARVLVANLETSVSSPTLVFGGNVTDLFNIGFLPVVKIGAIYAFTEGESIYRTLEFEDSTHVNLNAFSANVEPDRCGLTLHVLSLSTHSI